MPTDRPPIIDYEPRRAKAKSMPTMGSPYRNYLLPAAVSVVGAAGWFLFARSPHNAISLGIWLLVTFVVVLAAARFVDLELGSLGSAVLRMLAVGSATACASAAASRLEIDAILFYVPIVVAICAASLHWLMEADLVGRFLCAVLIIGIRFVVWTLPFAGSGFY